MSGSLLLIIVASRAGDYPPLRVKYQARRNKEDIASSNIHVILTVDPNKKTNSVPLAGEMIPPKQHKIIQFF